MTSNLDVNTICFQELTFGKAGQKMMDISFDNVSKAWDKKVIFQLSSDSKPLQAKYGLSKPRENAPDTNKRSVDLSIDDPVIIQKISEIDNYVKEYAFNNSKTMFRKELNREQINDRYTSILKEKDGHTFISLKVKITDKPTPTKVIEHGTSNIRSGTVEDITPGSEVVPIVRLLSIWFMSDKFGISPQADKLIVFKAPPRGFLDDFLLENEYVME